MKKFDPRTILITTFILIIALIISKNYFNYLLVYTFILIHLYIFKLDIKKLVSILKTSIGLFLSIIFINYFFMGRSQEYIIFSLMRVFGVIVVSVSILSSMEISDIAFAIEKLLSPLEKVKIPVTVISTTFALSLKFIPLLKDEASRIILAQKARGIDYSLMSLKEKIRNIFTLIFPIIISGIYHSINLATAMEIRGFGAPYKKTRLYDSKIELKDLLYIIMTSIMMSIVIKNN